MPAQLALLPDPAPRRSLPLLTGSAMRTWRACARLFRYRYVDLVRPRHESDAMQFGTLMHAALEAWWRAVNAQPTNADAWLSIAAEVIWQATIDDPWRRARASALLLGYHLRWQDMTWDGEPLEVVDVEAEFRAPLVNPSTGHASLTWDRGGKIDCIVRGRSTGRVWILEHKSTSEDFSAGSPYRDKLVLDPQISHYMVGCRALGYEPAGCIYDVLRRPEQRPAKAVPESAVKWTKAKRKKCVCKGFGCQYCSGTGWIETGARPYAGQRLVDETPDEFYQRICTDIGEHVEDWYARMMVVRIGDEERRSAANDWELGLMIRHAERLGLFPQNPDACGRWGQKCPYLGVCKAQVELGDERYFRKAERAHEELSAPAGATGAPAIAGAAE